MKKNKTIRFLGIPLYKRREKNGIRKKYFLGICYSKKSYSKQTVHNKIKIPKDSKMLNIAFQFDGGVGDYLISSNYVYLVQQYIGHDKIRIDLYEHGVKNILSHIFKEHEFIDNIYDADKIEKNDYDLVVVATRFPKILECKKQKVFLYSEKLFSLVQCWEECSLRKERFIAHHPKLDGQLQSFDSLLGYHRYDQLDYKHFLNMKEKYELPIFKRNNAQKYLQKIGIVKNFITVHCGVDSRKLSNSTKEWPHTYFNDLLWQIKKKYPNIQVVQLGLATNELFNNIDINLLGKTDWEDLKIILTTSLIHIDVEGGLVHLRHALNGGKSIVLYGPTSPNVFGYSENINLRSSVCTHCCEWLTKDWQEKCILTGTTKGLCQYALTPEIVFKNFCQLYEDKHAD